MGSASRSTDFLIRLFPETDNHDGRLVLPDYGGGSVANIASSILASFGASPLPDVPLLPPVESDLLSHDVVGNARVVVLIVVDGLSDAARKRQPGSFLKGPVPHVDTTLTSVFPSTTAAALTSLQLGVAPATHGMVGYTLMLPSVGRVINMVTFKPVDGSALAEGSLDLTSIVRTPTIYDHLAAHDIESVIVSHKDYARSPLTIVQSGDTPYVSHRTAAEMAGLLYRQATRPGRRFVFGYWAGVDMLAHTYGPESDQCGLELRVLDQALHEGFFRPLAKSDNDVVVLLTADHGHTTVLEDKVQSLNDLAPVVGGWSGPPTGERRSVGLTLGDDESRSRLREAVGADGVVVSVEAAVETGLYGPFSHHPELMHRIGDTLLVSTGPASFPYRPTRKDAGGELSPGAHGSLTEEEMRVPLLAWRFGR